MNGMYEMEKINKKQKFNIRAIIHDVPAWLLILPAIILLVLICWRPIVMGIQMAFMNDEGTRFVGFGNFKSVLSDVLFMKALKNTVLYVLWSLIIGMGLPVVVAIMLNETIHFSSFIKSSLYLPQVIPTIAAALLWYFVYMPDETGLLNQIIGAFGGEIQGWFQNESWTIPLIIISITWKGFGFTAILYLASLQSINRELYEAAMIDGASIFKRTVKITLPHMYPMILLFGVNQVKAIFNIMIEPLSMTGGGPNNASLSLGLHSYRYAFQYFRMSESVALSILMWIIIIIFTIIYIVLDRKLAK